MSVVYVFAATKAEAAPIERLIGLPAKSSPGEMRTGRVGPNQVAIFIAGMGPNRARSAALAAFDRQNMKRQKGSALGPPDAAIMIGLCGGLTRPLAEGTIVSYRECRSTDANRRPLPCSPSLEVRLASVLKSKGIVCESVVGITSGRIATSKDARAQLAAAGAKVVDMESYEIIAASTQAGVPISVLRIVSDSVDQDLPDFNQAMKPNGDFDGWSALEVALGSPLLTARMISANRRAILKLTPALEALFSSDCFSPTRSGKAY